MNRVNLWHKIFSISSACLIPMLTRTELIDGSIITRSLSLREIVSGVRSTSFVVLDREMSACGWWERKGKWVGENGDEERESAYAASTSGLLCRSTT